MREVDTETPVVWPAWCYSGKYCHFVNAFNIGNIPHMVYYMSGYVEKLQQIGVRGAYDDSTWLRGRESEFACELRVRVSFFSMLMCASVSLYLCKARPVAQCGWVAYGWQCLWCNSFVLRWRSCNSTLSEGDIRRRDVEMSKSYGAVHTKRGYDDCLLYDNCVSSFTRCTHQR